MMAIIGYTQLMKDIFQLERSSVEKLLEDISKRRLSSLMLGVLKELARVKEETVSGLLRRIGENNTGGTYKTISSFLLSLEKDGILQKRKRGVRCYWSFTEKAEDLACYFRNS